MSKSLLIFLFFYIRIFSQTIDNQFNKLAFEIENAHTNGEFEKEKEWIWKAKQIIKKDDFYNQARFGLLEAHYLETTNISSDSCRTIFQNVVNLAKKSGDKTLMIDALGSSIDYNFFQDSLATKNRKAIANELFTFLKNAKNEQEIAKINGYLALYHMAEGNDNESIKTSLAALELTKKGYAKKEFTSDELAAAYYTVSRVYKVMFQPEKQNEYLQGMRRYVVHNQELLVYYYSIFARNLLRKKEIEKAKLYSDSLQNCIKKYPTFANWESLLEAHVFFTQAFSKFGDLPNAKIYVTKANEVYNKWKFENFEANINYTNGTVHLAEKNYAKAFPFFKKASDLANIRGYGDLYQMSLEKTAICLDKLGRWQEAYQFSKMNGLVLDSLKTQSTEAAFIETEAKFQNKEKQQEIEIKNLQINEANNQKKWLLSGLASVILALGLLFWNFKTKQKANKIINEKNVVLEKLNTDLVEANQTKAKLFGIISHDLRSPISQVYQFLRLQQLNPDLLSADQKTDLSGKIQTATGSLLETMEDLLLWSKTQMNEFNVKIQSTEIKPVIEQCIQLLKLNIEAKNLKIENNIAENITQETDPYFLQIIVRNLLQNAVKASPENGKIIVDFQNNAISIENEGEPFTQNQYEAAISSNQKQETLSGLGLKLIDELSQKIGAKVRFETVNDETMAVLSFA